MIVVGSSGSIGSKLLEMSGGIPASRRDMDHIEEIMMSFSGPLKVVDASGVSHDGKLSRLDQSKIKDTIDVNLTGAIRLASIFARCARTRPGSSLLFLGSVVGRIGVYGAVVYGASKSGLVGLVRGLSRELAPIPATVNLIEMGYFSTGMMTRLPVDVQSEIINQIPLRRTGRMDELYRLCSEVLGNEYITGATIPITGGL